MTDTAKGCTWEVVRVTGRDEFQSRTYTVRCDRPVESGLWCPRHNALADKHYRAAQARREQRAARAARAARDPK